jgi:hypothetical protein
MYAYRNIEALEAPADLEIETCVACGEEYLDEPTSERLDAALAERYAEEVRRHAVAALDKLVERIPQQQLERLLGLSQGYLSRIRREPTSALVANLLILLAEDPDRMESLRKAWASAA